MKKKEENPYNIFDNHNFADSVSSTDCTGLIPGNPNSAETFDTYDDIYEFTGSPHNDTILSQTAKPSGACKVPDDRTGDSSGDT